MNTKAKTIHCTGFVTDKDHIYYHYNDTLKGIFILYMVLDPRTSRRAGAKFFKKFLAQCEGQDVYFSAEDPTYIQNHAEYVGAYGNLKVYKYVS